jgi:glycine hydroxymethyltransferase
MSHFAGLVAAGLLQSPFAYADSVMTTTHKSLRGPRHALMFVGKDEREFDKKLDKAVIPGLYGGPHNNTVAGVAIALKEADSKEFKAYAKQVIKNAKALGKALQKLGWRLVSGGTDTHLLLVDVWMDGKGLSGKEASARLEKAGIIVNMNTIPGDKKNYMETSGIRLGTCAETTRGAKEEDMQKIAAKIDKVLRA